MKGMTAEAARQALASVNEGPTCSCASCKEMCKRPCWPTPEEAEALIAAGYGEKLMNDYWGGDSDILAPKWDEDDADEEPRGQDIHLLCPAELGREGGSASFWREGGCTFQNPDGLCLLHDAGLKPLEGRLARCEHDKTDLPPVNVHKCVAALWDTAKGRAIVERWCNR